MKLMRLDVGSARALLLRLGGVDILLDCSLDQRTTLHCLPAPSPVLSGQPHRLRRVPSRGRVEQRTDGSGGWAVTLQPGAPPVTSQPGSTVTAQPPLSSVASKAEKLAVTLPADECRESALGASQRPEDPLGGGPGLDAPHGAACSMGQGEERAPGGGSCSPRVCAPSGSAERNGHTERERDMFHGAAPGHPANCAQTAGMMREPDRVVQCGEALPVWQVDSMPGGPSPPCILLERRRLVYAAPLLEAVDVGSLAAVLVTSTRGLLALPYLTRDPDFRGKIYATEPSWQLGQLAMDELLAYDTGDATMGTTPATATLRSNGVAPTAYHGLGELHAGRSYHCGDRSGERGVSAKLPRVPPYSDHLEGDVSAVRSQGHDELPGCQGGGQGLYGDDATLREALAGAMAAGWPSPLWAGQAVAGLGRAAGLHELYSEEEARECMRRVTTLRYGEKVLLGGSVEATPFAGGDGIGSCTWLLEAQGRKVAHLGSASLTPSHAAPLHAPPLMRLDALLLSSSCLSTPAVTSQMAAAARLASEGHLLPATAGDGARQSSLPADGRQTPIGVVNAGSVSGIAGLRASDASPVAEGRGDGGMGAHGPSDRDNSHNGSTITTAIITTGDAAGTGHLGAAVTLAGHQEGGDGGQGHAGGSASAGEELEARESKRRRGMAPATSREMGALEGPLGRMGAADPGRPTGACVGTDRAGPLKGHDPGSSASGDASASVSIEILAHAPRSRSDALDWIGRAVLASVTAGGCILLPVTMERAGDVLDVLGTVYRHLRGAAQGGKWDVPVFLVSPCAHKVLAYAATVCEWLAPPWSETVFAPQPPFSHVDMARRGLLHVAAGLDAATLRGVWREPCVVLAGGGPWLRQGASVTLLERWRSNPRCALLATEGLPDLEQALAPFLPMSMRVLGCPLETSLDLDQVARLVAHLSPGRCALPDSLLRAMTAQGIPLPLGGPADAAASIKHNDDVKHHGSIKHDAYCASTESMKPKAQTVDLSSVQAQNDFPPSSADRSLDPLMAYPSLHPVRFKLPGAAPPRVHMMVTSKLARQWQLPASGRSAPAAATASAPPQLGLAGAGQVRAARVRAVLASRDPGLGDLARVGTRSLPRVAGVLDEAIEVAGPAGGGTGPGGRKGASRDRRAAKLGLGRGAEHPPPVLCVRGQLSADMVMSALARRGVRDVSLRGDGGQGEGETGARITEMSRWDTHMSDSKARPTGLHQASPLHASSHGTPTGVTSGGPSRGLSSAAATAGHAPPGGGNEQGPRAEVDFAGLFVLDVALPGNLRGVVRVSDKGAHIACSDPQLRWLLQDTLRSLMHAI